MVEFAAAPAHFLFHDNNEINCSGLRSLARREVEGSLLIRSAAKGNLIAARALHVGFWPFVSEFEIAIDRHTLPRKPLQQKYGARANQNFPAIAAAVRQMKAEEGSHAGHWREDAKNLGVVNLTGPNIRAVQQLIAEAYSTDLPRFFSVLAGTEFIAEELSTLLCSSAFFTRLFERKRWVWGEIHIAPHGNGPSHLEIDLDLARAYSRETPVAVKNIERVVQQTISLFGKAAREVVGDNWAPVW